MQRLISFPWACTLAAVVLALPVAVRPLLVDSPRCAPESLAEALENAARII